MIWEVQVLQREMQDSHNDHLLWPITHWQDTLNNEEEASEKEQIRKLVRWVRHFKSVASIISSLDEAFTGVVRQVLASSKGQLIIL